VITLVWFVSVAIFIAAVAKEGWRSLPRWHRSYAELAVPVLFVWVLTYPLDYLKVRMPEAVVAPVAVVWGAAWMVVVYWGIAVGVSQAVRLSKGRLAGSTPQPSGMQPASATTLPSVVQCWSCNTPLPVTEEARGRNIKCEKCGVKQRLPA